MPSLPSYLDNPISAFLNAAQHGASLGVEIAKMKRADRQARYNRQAEALRQQMANSAALEREVVGNNASLFRQRESQGAQSSSQAAHDAAIAKNESAALAQRKWEHEQMLRMNQEKQAQAGAQQTIENDQAQQGIDIRRSLGGEANRIRQEAMDKKAVAIPNPQTPAQQFAASPVMQKEEQDTMAQIESGVPPLKAIQDHPTLIQNPPYAQKWGPVYRSEMLRGQRAEDKAESKPNDQWRAPSKSDITLLILNPDRAAVFEQKFGAGTAAPYLPEKSADEKVPPLTTTATPEPQE